MLIAGHGGSRPWDPVTGAMESLVSDGRFAALDADDAGRTVVARLGADLSGADRTQASELVVLDAEGRRSRRITSRGNPLALAVAVDTAGRFLVTGDTNGLVRVGSIEGDEPHLLAGHVGPVQRVWLGLRRHLTGYLAQQCPVMKSLLWLAQRRNAKGTP